MAVLNFEVGGQLTWKETGDTYRINKIENGHVYFHSVRSAPSNKYEYEISYLRERISRRKVGYSAPEKKEGPEMQHCPFCEAAWLLPDANIRQHECKYCGGALV